MVAAITTLTITDAKSGITALSVMVIATWLKGDTMGNLIDSQAAIDMCMRAEAKTGYDAACLIAQLPSAQPERQINLDGFETPIEILSALRSQFNCFDEQEEKAYHALSVAIHALSAQSEIIYCKDCQFTDGKGPIADGRYWCVLHAGFMDFCSDAERRKADE